MKSTTQRSMQPVPMFELHFSVLTSMLTQFCHLRTLSPKLPVSEAVAPRYAWGTGTTAQSPFRCSDVLPPSRMSSANNVLAQEPSLRPSTCRSARRRDPGKAKVAFNAHQPSPRKLNTEFDFVPHGQTIGTCKRCLGLTLCQSKSPSKATENHRTGPRSSQVRPKDPSLRSQVINRLHFWLCL